MRTSDIPTIESIWAEVKISCTEDMLLIWSNKLYKYQNNQRIYSIMLKNFYSLLLIFPRISFLFPIFSPKRPIFLPACATCSKLPNNISTMLQKTGSATLPGEYLLFVCTAKRISNHLDHADNGAVHLNRFTYGSYFFPSLFSRDRQCVGP